MEDEFKPKRYACMQWPFLRIGSKVKFEAGLFTADNQEAVDAIESNEAFGVHIHPIKWEKKAEPLKKENVEELIESEIVEAMAKRQPRVRRGALGTR